MTGNAVIYKLKYDIQPKIKEFRLNPTQMQQSTEKPTPKDYI